MNMHTSYPLTLTYTDTDAQAHIQLYIHQKIFMPAHTHASARALKHARAYKTKIHPQTLRTTHSQIHSYVNTRPWTCVNTHNLKTYTRTYTDIYVCMRAPINNTHQYARSQTDTQTCLYSITHAHTYALESVCVVFVCVCMRSVCVRVSVYAFVCVQVCLWVCDYECYVLYMCVLVSTSVSLSVIKAEKISTHVYAYV